MEKPESHGLDRCGEVIRTARENYGLTQAELARRLGAKWDRVRLNKVERGKMPISRSSIHELAAALEMRPERLYLMCLKTQYPVLSKGEVGVLLESIVGKLTDSDSEGAIRKPHKTKR